MREGFEKDLRKILKRKTIKWTEAKIQEVADQYDIYSDFASKERKAKASAYHLGILDKVTAHMTRKRRRSAEVSEKEIFSAAAKCTSKSEFIKKYRNLHYHAKVKGILHVAYKKLKK